MSMSIARRPTPRDHNDPRLHHYVPISGGTGCLVPLVALILLIAAWFTWNLDVVEAQTPQPTMYRVGQYQRTWNGSGAYTLFWFEQNDIECYVVDAGNYQAGVGISCLRKP